MQAILSYKPGCIVAEDVVTALFQSNVQLWWLRDALLMVDDEAMVSAFVCAFYTLYEQTPDVAMFLSRFLDIYRDLEAVSFKYIKTIERVFINHVCSYKEIVDAVLDLDIALYITNPVLVPHFLSHIENNNATFDVLQKHRSKLIEMFPGEKNVINHTIDRLISVNIIPGILQQKIFEQSIDVLACAYDDATKKLVQDALFDFIDQFSIISLTSVVAALKLIQKLHDKLSYVQLLEPIQNIWKREQFGAKKWNNWFKKYILSMYHLQPDGDLITDMCIVAKSIHNIQNYDRFLVMYMISSANRIKTMMFNPDTFRANYNTERNVMDSLDITHMYDTLKTIKKLFVDALKSHHLSKSMNHPVNSILLDFNVKIKDDKFVPPPEILGCIDDAKAFYTQSYPERSLYVCNKNTIVTCRLGDTIISGTIVPMSILYVVANSSGQVDEQAIAEQLSIEDANVVRRYIHVLVANNLIKDNAFAPPSTNIILNENVKSVSAEIEKNVQYDRNTITRCFTVRTAKQYRTHDSLTRKMLFDTTKNAIKYFDLQYKDFEKVLQKLVDTEMLFANGQFYSYDQKN